MRGRVQMPATLRPYWSAGWAAWGPNSRAKARMAEFDQRYEEELMNPREALSLGSISRIVVTSPPIDR